MNPTKKECYTLNIFFNWTTFYILPKLNLFMWVQILKHALHIFLVNECIFKISGNIVGIKKQN